MHDERALIASCSKPKHKHVRSGKAQLGRQSIPLENSARSIPICPDQVKQEALAQRIIAYLLRNRP